ncbi:hypothetical protein [Paenibacillus illinoisensis]|uniref:hypothetical protein n=1 Tax=Paenibacillus illinoisensis TaxID=59845 RepID=UPI00301BCF38
MPKDKYIRQVKNQENSMKDELKNSVKDQLLKKGLYEELKKNTIRKKLMSRWAITSEVTGIIFLLLFILFVFYSTSMILEETEPPKYYGPIFAALFLVGYFSIVTTGLLSDKHVKRNYKDRYEFLRHKFSFKTLFKSTSIINFNMGILYSIQCDAIFDYLKQNGKTGDTKIIDYLIEYYTDESERIRKKRWIPFAILIALSLPTWTLFIRSLFEEGWSNVGFVLFLSLLVGLTIMVTFIKRILDALLFKVPNDYLHLANILRTINSF